MTNDKTKEKIQYFLDNKIELHINLTDGTFYNAFVIRISEKYFEVNDRKLGIVPVFWDELSAFEPCRKEERK